MWPIPGSMAFSDDHEAVSWVQQGYLPRDREVGYRVGDIVPQGFEAYARIFHPASRYIADRREWVSARWSEVAAWTGRIAHPAMQFHSILGHPENPDAKPDWGSLPDDGTLDADQTGALTDILMGFTTTPDACCFCIWEGWGWLGDGESFAYLGPMGTTSRPQDKARSEVRKRVASSEPMRIGHFGYFLFKGRLDAILEIGAPGDRPSLWWPRDHAWYVGTDIDMTSTFVGGTAECIAQLVADPRMEAMPIEIDIPIHVDGDTVNR